MVAKAAAAAQLDAVTAVVRSWVEALLRRTARAEPLVDGVPRSRYAVAAGEVVRALTEQRRPDEAALVTAAEVAWPAAAATPRLAALCDNLGLGDVDARIVAALIAAEHDAELERAYAYAWDDFSRRRADVGFLVDLVGGGSEERRAEVRRALGPRAPLRRLRVVLVGVAGDADSTPVARRMVRLADRIVEHLTGSDEVDAALDGVAAMAAPVDPTALVLSAATRQAAERALPLDGAGAPRLLLCGPAGVGKALLARSVATLHRRPVLEVDVAALLAAPDRLDDRMARIVREAALTRALLLLRGGDALGDDTAHAPAAEPLARALVEAPVPLVLSCRKRPTWLLPRLHDLVEVDVEAPGVHARVTLWEQALGEDRTRVAAGALEAIAARFALTGAPIHRAAERVRAQAQLASAPSITLDDLTAASRVMLQHRLGAVARRIEPGFAWDDLVLPAETLDGLREMVAFASHKAFLLEEWGFDRKLPYGRGVSAILAGPPGTGKTMVAQLLARELGYDLYVIELAQVVNKYIGETEKNLARVFDEAESSHAILFFDEADALFARRTDVKSSTDRYANLEVNYLLQRMEAYAGVTLLATNLEQGIDEAFKRRVRFTIAFEMPEAPVRELLWKSMVPAQAPVEPGVDWRRLAERYEMAGGHIKKAVVRAAARALARGKSAMIMAADLEAAAQLEYGEMGRVV
jgi:ATP-dependent 26S proteasome regulatory subunit